MFAPLPGPTRPIRIILIDGHDAVRRGVAILLNAMRGFEVVADTCDAHDAVRLVTALAPDVVVIDVAIPGADGLAATRALKTVAAVAIVALTHHGAAPYVHALLDAGALGCVLKQSPSSELAAAIRAVAEGKPYLDVAIGDLRCATSTHRPSRARLPAPSLSERETVVLRDTACGYGNKEIAARLGLSVKTVEAHKANGMRKLGVHGRTDVVRYALVQGWLKQD